ncbi:MAG: hypothetical protein ACR2LT_03215 [Pyrinomonadaceae bacterium]
MQLFQSWTSLYSWKGQKPNFEVIIRKFKVERPQLVELIVQDLEKLLVLPLSENELKNIIDNSTGSGFSPLNTRRAFLERILEILKEPIEETKKNSFQKG